MSDELRATPETDSVIEANKYQESGDLISDLINLACTLERQRDEARIPICIGQPIIQILSKEGQWVSINGNGLVAADCLFRKDPYAARDAALARVKELEKALAELEQNLFICSVGCRQFPACRDRSSKSFLANYHIARAALAKGLDL